MLKSRERHIDTTIIDSSRQVVSGEKSITTTADVHSHQQTLLFDLRKELSETQKIRAQLQKKVELITERVERLTTERGVKKRQVEELSKEKNSLERKLRDRDEELIVKTRLVEVRISKSSFEKLMYTNKIKISVYSAISVDAIVI